MNNTDVPIWEKYTLTIEEASSVLFIIYAPPLLCVIFYKQADGFGKLR